MWMSSMSADAIASLRTEFLKIDVEGTGLVSADAFRRIMSTQGSMTTTEADDIFSRIDQDGSHFISYSEFLAAALSKKVYMDEARIREAFRRMDVDGTGIITRENLRVILGDDYTPEKADEMIREADIKGNGVIDFEEFLAVIRSEGTSLVRNVAGAPTMVAAGINAMARAQGVTGTSTVVGDGGGIVRRVHPAGEAAAASSSSGESPAAARLNHFMRSSMTSASGRLEEGGPATMSERGMLLGVASSATGLTEADDEDDEGDGEEHIHHHHEDDAAERAAGVGHPPATSSGAGGVDLRSIDGEDVAAAAMAGAGGGR